LGAAVKAFGSVPGVTGGDAAGDYMDDMAERLAHARIVRAGFPESSRYADGTPMATAAAVNNFGAPAKGIPPRPFFTTAVNAGKPVWGRELGERLKAADYDSAKALESMGMVMAGGIAEKLVETTGPALSPVTLLLRSRFPTRDGMTPADVWQAFRDVKAGVVPSTTGTGGKPLVWSGQMLNHLQGPSAYEVS
jgi:hypothetical protein